MVPAKIFRSSHRSIHPREEHWIPLSDLMTGLMMVFMLVAIVFMIQVEAESEKVKELMHRAEQEATQMKEVAVLYDETRERLYADLESEFSADLPRWNANLDRDLAIRFEEPDVQGNRVKKCVTKG